MIYYDAPRVSDFGAIIKGSKNIKIEKMDIVNDKGANITLPAVGGNIKASKSYEATIEESILFDCREFEKLLVGRDDYFDFTENVGLDIATLGRGHIIKFDSTIKVPEEFDLTQTIDKFKPMLIASLVKDNMDQSEQVALQVFLETSDTKIPVLIDFGEQLMCSKLISNNMLVKYEDMEEYEELEVTIIARITSGNMVNAKKAFYDPLKDFMTLNRAMRRSIGGRTDGLYEIYADRDYRTIEILAIYQ